MLWEHVGPCLEDEDAVGMRLVEPLESRGEDGAERTAADHDEIERPRVRLLRGISAGKGLVEAVADVTSSHIEREVRAL
jgi:hypothetical protein